MLNSLKSKFLFLVIILIVIIGVLGIFSSSSLYRMTNEVELLISNNYDSIKVLNQMKYSIKEQNNAIANLIRNFSILNVETFYNERNNFEDALEFQNNNITEEGENDLVQNLNSNYNKYLNLFDELKNNREDTEFIEGLYADSIRPLYSEILNNIDELIKINENSIFGSRDELVDKWRNVTVLIVVITVFSVFMSIYLSLFLIKRFLSPLFKLINEIKTIKSMSKREPLDIETNDELGILIQEFNKMTERIKEFEKSTIEQLGEEKSKSVALINNIPDPIFVLDENMKLILTNYAFKEFFKCKEEVKHKFIFDIVKNLDLYDILSNLVKSDKENDYRVIKIEIEDQKYFFNVLATKIRDVNANLNGIIVSLRNITKEKEFENMRLGLISSVSHEFKTPLTSIILGLSILEEKIKNIDSENEELVLTIKEDVEKISNLISNLVNLRKIDDIDAFYEYDYEDLNEIVRTSVEQFEFQANKENKNIYVDLQEIPNIYIDKVKISWVINNLISNSLKHTKENDDIAIKTYQNDNENVIFEIADTGKGIKADKIENIFKKYYSSRENKTNYVDDSGMGLTISKEILDSHGASIEIESQNEKGTKFIITFSKGDNKNEENSDS
ncbi:sensor histidine kinase [Geotoga petraea]|nr:ATP-binding protein [Geotoga petraea]SDC25732.1 PAS domain S-box-containing protein [Geotoga petraea]